MAWIPQNDRNHFVYGSGDWSKYYWNSNYNPNANITNCLANCTTLVYGRCLENGYPAPVTTIRNANLWHTVVNTSAGWSVMSYSSGMMLYAGDIIEWASSGANHVGIVEQDGTDPWQSSSWYTDDQGTGTGGRNTSIVGSTLAQVSTWMVNNYPYRFYHSERMSTENIGGGHNTTPTYIIRYSGAQPPTPTENLTITIVPSSYTRTMQANEDYEDFTFNITVSGIPAGQSVSGGNTYPGLTRIYNSGWSYTDYVVSGVTYRTASKQQTLRYDRESNGAYTTVKHMYYNLSFSTGSVSTDTPMYITVKAKVILKIIAGWMANRRRRAVLEIK